MRLLAGADLPQREDFDMGGDDYVILINTRHTDAHKAASDLNDQVSSLKQAVIRLIEIYEEAERRTECGGDQGAMLKEHRYVIAVARSMVTANVQGQGEDTSAACGRSPAP
jgi:hypothetical protein